MDKNRMINDHAVGELSADIIFKIAGMAREATSKYGSDNVYNASIGALTDDNGNLLINNVFYDVLKGLPNVIFADYAAMPGEPEFLEASIKACFGDVEPQGYTQAVAVMGGTAAIKHVLWNYADDGDEILVTDWNWTPYNQIAYENKRVMKNFNMFTDDNKFDVVSLERNIEELFKKQNCVIAILNFPAHNPTGYTPTREEAGEIYDSVEKLAKKNPDKKIVLLFDVAYIDFAGDKGRDFIRAYKPMPNNVLSLLSYSLSKTATAYGLRTASLISLSSLKEIALETKAAVTFSTRGTYTGCVRAPQHAFVKVYNDLDIRKKFEAERDKHVALVQSRAQAFLNEAKKVGLKCSPYQSGFFISIPCENSMKITEALYEKNTFVAPMPKGLRLAICSLAEWKCAKLPAILKDFV
jgi:aromatic-amino-acid transaminase